MDLKLVVIEYVNVLTPKPFRSPRRFSGQRCRVQSLFETSSNSKYIATIVCGCLRLVHLHRSAGASCASTYYLEVENGTHSEVSTLLAICGGFEVNSCQITPPYKHLSR